MENHSFTTAVTADPITEPEEFQRQYVASGEAAFDAMLDLLGQTTAKVTENQEEAFFDDDDVEDDAPVSPYKFGITSEETAGWYLSKLASLNEEEARIKANADRILKRIQINRSRLQGQFGPQLEAWSRFEIDRRKGRSRSLDLLQGRVGFRKLGATVRIIDMAAATACAVVELTDMVEEIPAVPASYKLDTVAYKKLAKAVFNETGELMAGTEHIPASESMTLDLNTRSGKKNDDNATNTIESEEL